MTRRCILRTRPSQFFFEHCQQLFESGESIEEKENRKRQQSGSEQPQSFHHGTQSSIQGEFKSIVDTSENSQRHS